MADRPTATHNGAVILLIVLALGAAYANSLTAPFIFDDGDSIVGNPTIRHLWPLWDALTPPHGRGTTVEGRPILNLSFAINYSFGGLHTRGYHVTNVVIHILACCALFGIIRRTIDRSCGSLRRDAAVIAGLCALIWGLHPLQTESVSYVAQRAESLMGLFFLTAVYGVARAAESTRAALWWTALAVFAALLCAGTKEVAATLPIIILFYDRTFWAGSFSAALRERRTLYIGLALSWVLIVWLVVSTGDRGGTIGAQAGITPWEYALCQCKGLFHYVGLSLWPHDLVFDYGKNFISFPDALPWAVALLVVLFGTAYALTKHPPIGFLGAWFFIILGPTSSFVGGTRQMLAEHRVYLSLASVVVGFVLLLYHFVGRRSLLAAAGLAVALLFATIQRNEIFLDETALWQDTVNHRPNHAGAHNNLALLLAGQSGRQADAIAHFEAALRLEPRYAAAHSNLATLLATLPGRQTDAIDHYEAALRLEPNYAEAHNNLASLLAAQPGRLSDALAHYETALRLRPNDAVMHVNLANLLANLPGRQADALAHFEEALRRAPDYPAAHNNLAILLANQLGRPADALAHYEIALRLKPDNAVTHNNVAMLLANQFGRTNDAIAHFETALRLQPDSFVIQFNLAAELAKLPEKRPEALAHFEAALRIDPSSDAVKNEIKRLRETSR